MVVKRGIGPTRTFMDDEREHRRSGVVPPFSAILLINGAQWVTGGWYTLKSEPVQTFHESSCLGQTLITRVKRQGRGVMKQIYDNVCL